MCAAHRGISVGPVGYVRRGWEHHLVERKEVRKGVRSVEERIDRGGFDPGDLE